MKKLGFLASTITMVLILSLLLASCQRLNKDDVLSNIGSSEITSSDTATSEPEKEKEPESSKPENSSKPQVSSKPKESSKPSVSSKPKPSVSSKPAPIELPTLKPTPKPDDEAPNPTTSSAPEPESSKPAAEPTPEQKEDAERLIGKWAISEDIGESMREGGFTVTGSATVTTIYEFTSSGTVIAKIDENEFMTNARPIIEQVVTQLIVDQYQMSVDEFVAQVGISFDEFVTLTMQSTIEEASYISEYKLDANGINIKDDTTGEYALFTYEFKGDDELTLTYEGDSQTFTRMK